MAITWVSGKKGYVKIEDEDGVPQEYNLGDWSIAMHAEFLKRNVFRTDSDQGFQDGDTGFKSAKVSVKGYWSPDYSPVAVGQTVTCVLGITEDGPYEYEVTVHVTDLTPGNTAEDGPTVDISGDSVGVFGHAMLGDG